MGLATEEEGVLKLVHRGRHVEIHKKPILAKEVMRQNPKHLITRPDFFEYPWVVVRPDSMLNLGRAFLIVPAHTVYQLMKANGYNKQSSPPCLTNPSCSGILGPRPTDQNLPRKSNAGERMAAPKHRSRRERPNRQVQDEHWRRRGPGQPVHQTESEYESAPESVTRYQTSYLEFKRTWMSDGYESAASAGEDSSRVKPCLRKQDRERKPQPLRVAFKLPAKCEERNRKFPVYRA